MGREVSPFPGTFISKPTRARTCSQTTSWRIIATIASGIIGYAATGTWKGAASVAGLDLVVEYVGQLSHDFVWSEYVQWGYTLPPVSSESAG